MADKSFAIHTRHRPRRVAFLVDLDQEPASEILLSILRFNLDSWGGRHNPLVPLINKAVPESFYPLLDVADPDIFYIYGDFEPASLEAMHWRYSPTFVCQHMARKPVDSHSYWVSLREQATTREYLRNIRDKLPIYFPGQEPCLLQLEHGEGQSLSPFFLWNFGYTDSNYFAIHKHGISGCRPSSTNDHDLLELLGKKLNLVWPINVCGDAPLSRTSGATWRDHLPIYFGPSPWNVVAYWNDGLTTGATIPVHGGINQLWLTRTQIEDEAAYKHLIWLLQRRVYSSNQQRHIRMISYDTPEAELEAVGKKLAEDMRWTLHYGGCLKLDPPCAEPVQPRFFTASFLPRGEIEYATGREVHLTLRRPQDIEGKTDERWMVDALIYNPEQELWYSNAEPWWQLPRKPSIATLFNRTKPQRVIHDNRLSFEVGAGETTLDFEIPSNGKLFRHLLSPQLHYHLAADLRSTLRAPQPFEIRLSDKGRYLSGILALSPSLTETLHLFEHSFWRSLLQELSKTEPSEQLKRKLASDARSLMKNRWSMSDDDLESLLTHEVVFASKQLARAPIWLTFKRIQNLYDEYVKAQSEEERQSGLIDLRSSLSSLTKDNVMFQGAELRCPNCISSYWYSLEDMRKSIICRGCHVSFPLQAETEWSYQLNELVRVGIGDHGLSPVLRTLARLFDDAKDCFFFTPPVEFVTYTDQDKRVTKHEIDLAWIKDGLLGVAEVKNTTKLFKPSDFEDMAKVAQIVRPDILLIAAPGGIDEDLARGKNALEEILGAKPEVWTWGPEKFKHAPFWIER